MRSQAASTVPSYSRYREAALRGKETLLIEEVQSGSRLYSLEIAARVHRRHYQVLWVDDGEADVGLDERRRLVNGPADTVIQPNVVSGFRFAPYTDGLVLTFSQRLLVNEEFHCVGESFRTLFFSAWRHAI